MVQIIKEFREPSTSEKFMSAFSGVGQNLMQQKMQSMQMQKENDQFKKLTGLDITGIQDPKMREKAFELALQGKNKEAESRRESEKKTNDNFLEEKSYGKVREIFGQKFADIWKESPTGGRTELLKYAMDTVARGGNLDQLLQSIQPNESAQEKSFSSAKQGLSAAEKKKNEVDEQLNTIQKNQDIGLTPAEKVKRGKDRFDAGIEFYQEAGTKLRKSANDKQRLEILDTLSTSDKLPKNFGRLNVDKEGNLRLPFASTPEAQRYVKTLNEFSEGAKDSYGSRVTNFDLQQYFKRFPNLLNNKEGRKQIIQQMKIVNDINSIYYKNLKNIYDKSGGVRNIDADVAERLAQELSEPMIEEKVKKFNEIGQFSSKPSPEEFKGKKIRDKDTGEIFQSNGTDWVKAE